MLDPYLVPLNSKGGFKDFVAAYLTNRLLSTLAAAIIVCIAVPSTSDARPPDRNLQQVEQLANEARAAFKERRFEAAIGYYMRAYRLEPAGALLYNIAYVYDRKLGEAELAVTYYRRYIQAIDAEPDVVERAIARVSALKQRPKVPFVDSSRPRAPRNAQPAPRPNVSTDPNAGMSGQEITGWVTLGLGVAALGGATVVSVMAKNTHDGFKASGDLVERDALRDTGKSEALTADILWGVGGAAVVTGLIVALTADKRGSTSAAAPRWRVGAAVGDGGAVLLFGGTL